MEPKKIIIDLYSIGNRNVGLGEFSYKLGEALYARASEMAQCGITLTFIVPIGFAGCFGPKVKYIVADKFRRLFIRYFLRGYDLFHSVHQFGLIKFIKGADKTLLTLHDLNFLYEKHGAKQERYKRRMYRRIIAADQIAFISNFAAADVKRVYPRMDRPYTIVYNGVTDLAPVAAASNKSIAESGYLLHISSLQPKKNPELLVRMMQFLPNERLIIVGNWDSSYGNKLKGLIAELELNNVSAMQHVDNQTKALLYANCKAFLFPSLCEGFGLPPLEAMKFGKPVFLSTLTSLPEVGGDVAFYFDKLNPEDMAGVVASCLENSSKSDLSERIKEWSGRFTWEKCASGYISIYLKMLDID